MKIAVVYLGRRGSMGAISYELAMSLSIKADVCAVVSSNADNIELWRSYNIRLIETSTFEGWASAIMSMLNFWKINNIAKQIQLYQPDIILYPSFHIWFIDLQRHLSAIPYIAFVHDVVPHPGFLPRVIAFFENMFLKKANRCIILSETFREAIRQRGMDPEKIEVIPHGNLAYYQNHYSTRTFQKQERAHKNTLLFFGRLTSYKGLDILLRAYHVIMDRYDVELLIVGAGNISPFKRLLYGLQNVRIINRWIAEDEVAQYFQQATLVVLPYVSASQSGVIPLAAMFKLPVIATRVGGIPEQIADGETGILVQPGSVEQLSAAMERLLNDPDQAARLGNALYIEYVQNRNWLQVSEKILVICSKVLQ